MPIFKPRLFLSALLLLACHRPSQPVTSQQILSSGQNVSSTTNAAKQPQKTASPTKTALAPAPTSTTNKPASPSLPASPLTQEQAAEADWQAELKEWQLAPITGESAGVNSDSPAELQAAVALVQKQKAAGAASVSLAQASGSASVPAAQCDLACRTEADLAQHLPLNQQQWLGGHNAYNYTGIFKNQTWNVTEQLEAGVRVLELDLHTRLFSDTVRVCHGAGSRDCLLNPFGVKDYAPLLNEIKTWISQHPDQLLILELENHVKNEKAVLGPIREAFGTQIYRADERPAAWAQESPAQILARGKRMIVADFGKNRFDGKLVWDQNELSSNLLSKEFSAGCKVKGQPMGDKPWGFYDDKTFSKPQPLTAQSIPTYLACDVRYLKVDRLNPTLIAARHFSWESLPSGKNCASAAPGQFRWQAERCEQVLPFACRVGQGWKVSSAQGDWQQGEATCQREFGETTAFAPPRTYYQHHQLKGQLSAPEKAVWLGYRAP